MEEGNDNNEDISIDLGKVKRFLKRKTENAKEKEGAIKKEIEKEEEKIEKLEEIGEKAGEGEEDINEKIGEEKEKLSMLKEKKKALKEEEKKVKKEEKEIRENEEDIVFDIKKIKNLFKRKGKEVKVPKKSTETGEISFDPKKAWQFVLEHKTLFLLLIPIFLSIYFRAYPIYLPATDSWAENTVYSNIQGQISAIDRKRETERSEQLQKDEKILKHMGRVEQYMKDHNGNDEKAVKKAADIIIERIRESSEKLKKAVEE